MSGQLQRFFPYLPDHSTWDEFNGNLFLQYGQRNIVRSEESQWQETASSLVQSFPFSAYPVPDPEGFATWQDWARAFVTVVNGPI
jgi:hypothetical protein